jgi:uncharacterized protein YbaP (TraB family)
VVLALVVVTPLDAVAQTARAGFDKGLLWRVEKPGAAPSYLFGTVHLADKRVTTLPHAVKQQLDAAQSFTMEIALDPSNTAGLVARMVERMQPQLRAGNAFVAVGALHLYGEQGILGLLQRDGYRVSRMY